MSEEQLNAFLAKVQADTLLKEQLKAKGADVVAIAKSAGFSITTEDLKSLQPLSEAELEGISGGCDTGLISNVRSFVLSLQSKAKPRTKD